MRDTTTEQLTAILKSTDPCDIKLTISTDVKLKKTGNPLKDSKVTKRSIGVWSFGKPYQDMVNEALDASGKIGNFETNKLPWGTWSVMYKIIEHNGNHYLRYYKKTGEFPEVTYFVDGKKADDEQLKTINTYTTERKQSNTQLEAGLEGDKQIIPLVVNFDNIEEIEINGVVYR